MGWQLYLQIVALMAMGSFMLALVTFTTVEHYIDYKEKKQ